MQVAIERPNDFVSFQCEPAVRREIGLSYALWLLQRGRVTLVTAAELVGMNVDDFMLVCKENQVPV